MAQNLETNAISRSTFLRGVALLGMGAPLMACGTSAGGTTGGSSGKKSLSFATWGGLYGDSMRDYFVRPFQEESGIKVNQGVNSALAAVKSQVLSGNVQWDLVDLSGGDFTTGAKQDLFEPLDYASIDTTNLPDFARNDKFGVEYAFYLGGMGYSTKAISAADAPTSWEQFWDLKRFPGSRALSTHITDAPTLEGALLAAGVPMDQLYPLDVDEAFASISALGKGNVFWYEQNQESVNFLEQGQGALSSTFNGLVEIGSRGGAPTSFIYDQVQLTGDFLVIPRGAKNKDAAYELINFILNNKEWGAKWMDHTFYTVANTAAAKMVKDEVAQKIVTSPSLEGKFFVKDNEWWGEHGDAVTLQFQRLISS